ncbi:hypothetical protein LJR074_003174 [Acidovorax sp. LjRoot74]|uniref:hypothetical protein n=1 Tax=Acidovorax sp. LjRoot74 TaxID=3342337 RepID=UPI003ECEF83F
MATERDISFRRGSSVRIVARWETEPYLFAAISSITRGAPAVVNTQQPHGLPDGWKVAVVDALGMTQLNAKSNPPKPADFRRARVRSTTQIEFNDISSALFGAHRANTGFLQWLTPHDMLDYKARMDIKDRVGGTILMSLTSDSSSILISNAEKTITLVFEPADTNTVPWSTGVYDLEMVAPGGFVTPILFGSFELTTQVTTTE